MADFSFVPGELELMMRAWDEPIASALRILSIEIVTPTERGDRYVQVMYEDRRLDCMTLMEAVEKGLLEASVLESHGWRSLLAIRSARHTRTPPVY